MMLDAGIKTNDTESITYIMYKWLCIWLLAVGDDDLKTIHLF